MCNREHFHKLYQVLLLVSHLACTYVGVTRTEKLLKALRSEVHFAHGRGIAKHHALAFELHYFCDFLSRVQQIYPRRVYLALTLPNTERTETHHILGQSASLIRKEVPDLTQFLHNVGLSDVGRGMLNRHVRDHVCVIHNVVGLDDFDDLQ